MYSLGVNYTGKPSIRNKLIPFVGVETTKKFNNAGVNVWIASRNAETWRSS
jgi:hypothetical protein